MNQPKSFFKHIFVFGLIVLSSLAAFGQTDTRPQIEPSYDITLRLVIGTNESGQRADLPADVTKIVRDLKTNFNFANYRLAGTFLGRVSNNGSFEYKSVSNILGGESVAGPQSFLEWSITKIRNMPNAKGQNGFQAQFFRFGAKVPVMTGSVKDETGKITGVVNYEAIGLNLSTVGIQENVPALIGTINLPGNSGTIFLIVSTRPSE